MPEKISRKPAYRRLSGYAFDPSLSLQLDTALLNKMVYRIPWEDLPQPGPVGEYLEVIDYDPSTGKFYEPVSLDAPYHLASDGLEPDEGNPQFHQQMVYAVAMTTIKNFERAMGRPVLWSPQITSHSFVEKGVKKSRSVYSFVQRLRIYPHALRDANAYYSPQKKALLFGYFSSRPADETLQMPDSVVFTCLSHDIIAHETTHAILDGVYSRYSASTNLDVLAFHEAFADIVALFQHFTFPEVLKSQIRKTRGDLASQNMLGQLAQQFGVAMGGYGALRDAIGSTDENGVWHARQPSGNEYREEKEPHARGAILVAAIFEAFVSIYKQRVADLLRIATGGSGILPQGELHPDLVARLANTAAKIAGQVLSMCIRALDYCPPVDITFGDYLRGIVTADADLVAEDDRGYRLAMIDAFRKRGIYPAGVKSLSVESLVYPVQQLEEIKEAMEELTRFLRKFKSDIIYKTNREDIYNTTRDYVRGIYTDEILEFKTAAPVNQGTSLEGLHKMLSKGFGESQVFQQLTGLVFGGDWAALGIPSSSPYGEPMARFQVHSLQVASRVGPGGVQRNQIIVTLIQTAHVTIQSYKGNHIAKGTKPAKKGVKPADSYEMVGGCTLIFDLDTLQLTYAISKPLIDQQVMKKEGRLQLHQGRAISVDAFCRDKTMSNPFAMYFGGDDSRHTIVEPFCFLHQH